MGRVWFVTVLRRVIKMPLTKQRDEKKKEIAWIEVSQSNKRKEKIEEEKIGEREREKARSSKSLGGEC